MLCLTRLFCFCSFFSSIFHVVSLLHLCTIFFFFFLLNFLFETFIHMVMPNMDSKYCRYSWMVDCVKCVHLRESHKAKLCVCVAAGGYTQKKVESVARNWMKFLFAKCHWTYLLYFVVYERCAFHSNTINITHFFFV